MGKQGGEGPLNTRKRKEGEGVTCVGAMGLEGAKASDSPTGGGGQGGGQGAGWAWGPVGVVMEVGTAGGREQSASKKRERKYGHKA